jgi:6-phosphogluconolactonase
MQLEIFATREELNRSFTEYLKGILKDRKRVTVALSGGSTPEIAV